VRYAQAAASRLSPAPHKASGCNAVVRVPRKCQFLPPKMGKKHCEETTVGVDDKVVKDE